jgi:Kelch motif/Galactose oxidase, central domain
MVEWLKQLACGLGLRLKSHARLKAARAWCLIGIAFLCVSCGGSGTGGGTPLTPLNTTEQVPGLMTTGRTTSAVTLKSGDVLEVAGLGSSASTLLASGEVYEPKKNRFTVVSNQLAKAATRICLAALTDGTALEAGGIDDKGNALSQTEIYDPASNSFAPTPGAMNEARDGCTATTLQNGTVLIAGGNDYSRSGDPTTNTAEIYDPVSRTFAYTTGNMTARRAFQVAVLLASGKVLLAAGVDTNLPLASAELYDPSTGIFSATAGPLNSGRDQAAAVLLADGRVLIAGGSASNATLDTAELYDPATSTFSLAANTMSTGRRSASAAPLPDGNAIVGGGSSADPGQFPVASVDLFNASTNTFSPTAPLHIARMTAAAVVLPDSSPLILGGIDNQGTNSGNYEPSGEIYHLATGRFTVTGGLSSLRVAYASAPLNDGRVLIAGGFDAQVPLSNAEVFDPTTGHFTPTANNLDAPRVSLNGVVLDDGKVLIANGSTGTTAELFDPDTMMFTPTAGAMTDARSGATATPLRNGTVLIAGGFDLTGNALDSAAIYDPATETFHAATGTMTTPRAFHTATLLNNGDVLIAGGTPNGGFSDVLDTAELYAPATGLFTAAGNTMSTTRVSASANLLEDGKVLVIGGIDANRFSVATADLFDPETGLFTKVRGTMSNPRAYQSSINLPDGRILIAGGSVVVPLGPSGFGFTSTDTVDFYDPASNQFSPGVPMVASRDSFAATLLDSGKVLIPGGRFAGEGVGIAILETAEVYTP